MSLDGDGVCELVRDVVTARHGWAKLAAGN